MGSQLNDQVYKETLLKDESLPYGSYSLYRALALTVALIRRFSCKVKALEPAGIRNEPVAEGLEAQDDVPAPCHQLRGGIR